MITVNINIWKLVPWIIAIVCALGWWQCCNKPCKPKIIRVPGKTEYVVPPPVRVMPTDSATPEPKRGFFERIFTKSDEHRVRKGETMYSIGNLYGITAEDVRKLNNRPNYDIKAGEPIRIGTKEERDSIRKALRALSDSVYTYEKTFEDQYIKGKAITQSLGPVLSQSFYWESLVEPDRDRIFLGAGIDRYRTLSATGAYELKKGWLITGSVGVIGTDNIQVGVMKRLK